jgi:uncharacterized protein YbaP (TraB family)
MLRPILRPLAFLLRLVLILGVLLPGVAAGDAPAIPHGEGLLFRIEQPGQRPSYLFGTMHVADSDILDLPQPVRDAFRGARRVALEIVWDGVAAEYMIEATRLPEGQALADLIGPELFEAVTNRLDRLGVDPEELQKLRPWAVSFLLGGQVTRFRPGQPGDRYLDEWLRNEAGMDGKLVYGLETPAEHMAPFERLTDAQERAFLASALDERADRDVVDDMKALYLARDTAGLSRLAEMGESEMDPGLGEVFTRYLIVDRNEKMVARMEKLLARGDLFAAVGALHLPGEAGMLRLLEARGYRVTRVY